MHLKIELLTKQQSGILTANNGRSQLETDLMSRISKYDINVFSHWQSSRSKTTMISQANIPFINSKNVPRSQNVELKSLYIILTFPSMSKVDGSFSKDSLNVAVVLIVLNKTAIESPDALVLSHKNIVSNKNGI